MGPAVFSLVIEETSTFMKTIKNLKFSSLILSLTLAISACAPTPQRAKNTFIQNNPGITESDADLPPILEQEIVSTDDSLQKLLEDIDKASQYEAPTTAIKNGEDLMYVGFTKLKNVKSVYNRSKKELEVSGIAEIYNADKKTIRAKQEFKIKGKYKASTGMINLHPTEDNSDKDAVQVRAVVTCLKSEVDERFDCGRAIIDLFLKHKNNYYTEQLESTSFEKPKIVGGQKQPEKQAKPKIEAELVEPETENQVKVTPESKEKPQQPAIEVVEKTAEVSKTAIVIDESKEEADPEALAEAEEGDEESIAGRYEGKAALVELAKLFLSAKEREEAEDDEDKKEDDQAPSTRPKPRPDNPKKEEQTEVPVKIDTSGRMKLKNQAIGSPDQGRLRNASWLKTHIESYGLTDKVVIANPSAKNYYGTQEMMDVLEAIGKKISSMERNKLFISRISAKMGGRLPPSKSHQNGMDVDIGYFTVQGKVQFPVVASGGSLRKSDFSVAKTLEIFKFLMTQQVSPVDRLFVDQSIINSLCREAKNSGKFNGPEKAAYRKLFENMQHVDGHGNHFHLRLRCTPNQPDCRHRIYKKMSSCG